MTWEEAGLISEDPAVMESLRYAASRNLKVPTLQVIKLGLETGAIDHDLIRNYLGCFATAGNSRRIK